MERKETSEHAQTKRQQMISLLGDRAMTARELSQAMGIREKEVYDHLAHIGRTAAARNRRLAVLPFHCLACGYVFEERKRFTRPGRCPRCRKTRIQVPTYRLL